MKKYTIFKTIIILLIILFTIFLLGIKSKKYLDLGIKDFNTLNYEEAFVNYEKASILNPLSSKTNIRKAEIYEKIGNDKKAISEYKKAFAKNNNIDIKTKLIEMLIKNDMASDTIKYFLISTKNDNDNKYLIALSKALFLLGKKEDSIKILDKINTEDSSLQKSIYYFLNGEYEMAKIESRKAAKNRKDRYFIVIEDKNNNLDFYKITTAEALNELKQPYFGKIILENMLKEKKEYRDVYLCLANSYIMQNNLDKAKQNVEKAIEKDPIYGLSYYLLSQIDLKQENFSDSQKNIEKAKKYGYTIPITP